MIERNDSSSFEIENNQEINLVSVFKKIKRNTLLILSLTGISTVYSIFYAFSETPLYSGEFQILVRNDDKAAARDFTISGIPKYLKNVGATDARQTQELILKSPSVLNPVYEFVKMKYAKRNEDISNLSFKKWTQDYLTLNFVEDSDIFEITFRDKDKSLILSTLNMISDKYKVYSKRDYNKNLMNELNYLKNQEEIFKRKYEASFNKSNNFVIENNFYSTSCASDANEYNLARNDSINSIEKNIQKNIQSNTNSIRYSEQFALLDSYEFDRAKYSTKLKPNSEYLRKLDYQISKLKEGIQRPTRILLKNKELTNKRCRDESTLKKIQDQIILNQLDLAKQKDPWELISIPKVDDQKVYPNKKNIVLSFLLISFFISLLLSLLKDSIMGFIDDVGIIEKQLNAKFLGYISEDESQINAKIFDSNIKKILQNKDNKNNIGIYLNNKNSLINKYLSSNKDTSLIDLSSLDEIDNVQNILILIDQKNSTFNNIKKINKYVDLYQEKNFYWMYIETNKFF